MCKIKRQELQELVHRLQMTIIDAIGEIDEKQEMLSHIDLTEPYGREIGEVIEQEIEQLWCKVTAAETKENELEANYGWQYIEKLRRS